MDNSELVRDYVRKEYGALLENIAKNTSLSTDYVAEIVNKASDMYRIIDDIVILNGLGENLCIVCGENNNHESMYIQIPKHLLDPKTLDERLNERVKGHTDCYNGIDIFFRDNNKILRCMDCASFYGDGIDGGEILEECYRLKKIERGHRGVIAGNAICNFFGPNYRMIDEKSSEETKKMHFWMDIKPSMEKKTLQGYNSIITILEKAKLLK